MCGLRRVDCGGRDVVCDSCFCLLLFLLLLLMFLGGGVAAAPDVIRAKVKRAKTDSVLGGVTAGMQVCVP